MPGKPVVFPSQTFKSKLAATAFFKEMLDRYEDDETVAVDDADLLYELLLRHPNAVQKIGTGVASFYRAGTDHATSAFHILRSDGSRTDFSYYTCVDGRPSSLEADFYTACRLAVANELKHEKAAHFQAYGDALGRVPCSQTGELVRIDEADYRHTEPRFFEIVEEFIKGRGLTLSRSMLTPSQDLQYGKAFADPTLHENFCTFHRERRQLAIVKRGQTYKRP